MKIAGFDASMNSTGKCIITMHDETFDILEIDFYGYNKTKKRCVEEGNVHIKCVGTQYTQMSMFERQDIAYNILNIDMDDVKFAAIEGYSFGSTLSNSTFQIGEFIGGLKKMLYDQGKGIVIYPPSVVKYYATEKGNAQKNHMKMAFLQRYPQYYPQQIEHLPPFEDPQADLIDAFWIAMILRSHIMYEAKVNLENEITEALEHKSSKKVESILETEMFKKKT